MTERAVFAVYAVGAVMFFGAFAFAGKNPPYPGAVRPAWSGFELCGLFLITLMWPLAFVAVFTDVIAQSIRRKT